MVGVLAKGVYLHDSWDISRIRGDALMSYPWPSQRLSRSPSTCSPPDEHVDVARAEWKKRKEWNGGKEHGKKEECGGTQAGTMHCITGKRYLVGTPLSYCCYMPAHEVTRARCRSVASQMKHVKAASYPFPMERAG